MPEIQNPFQAFSVKPPGIVDRLITEISVTEGHDPATVTTAPPAHPTKALWDTGATRSVISPTVVAALGLVPVGVANVFHAGGDGTSPTYLVNFVLPMGVTVSGAIVTQSPLELQGFDVLIGMDVITLGDFSLSHCDGKTCFSFRTPSLGGTDYVQEHKAFLKAHIGRNDPCPCGRTRADGQPLKFKQCCGK